MAKPEKVAELIKNAREIAKKEGLSMTEIALFMLAAGQKKAKKKKDDDTEVEA